MIPVLLFTTFLGAALSTSEPVPPGSHSPSISDAKYTAAAADMEVLANDGEILCEVDTLYYTPLENLNDLPGLNTITPRDGILDNGGAWMLDPATGDWVPGRQRLDASPFIWRGPYVNYQRVTENTGTGYDPGTPIDPWGNPYLLFTPLGLAEPNGPTISLESYADSFDRWAIVCYGADGVKSDDDLIYLFGSSPTRFVVSHVRLISTSTASGLLTSISSGIDPLAAPQTTSSSSTPLWSLEIQGYNFGQSQQTSSVLVDAQPLSLPSSSWSSTRIIQPLPESMTSGDHSVALHVGGAVSRSFSIQYPESPTAVDGFWSLLP